MKSKTTIDIIVEVYKGKFWGRVKVNNNLIVDEAKSLDQLKKQMKKLVMDFNEIHVDDFNVSYDLTAFLQTCPISSVGLAKKAKISPDMMKQYSSGKKFPSEARVILIEAAVREIGEELAKVNLHKTGS